MKESSYERDEWCCTICGAKDKTLHVHHMYYVPRNDPWDYPGFTLKTLCVDCHDAESANRRRVDEELLMALRRHFGNYELEVLTNTLAFHGGLSVDPSVFMHALAAAMTNPEALAAFTESYLGILSTP